MLERVLNRAIRKKYGRSRKTVENLIKMIQRAPKDVGKLYPQDLERYQSIVLGDPATLAMYNREPHILKDLQRILDILKGDRFERYSITSAEKNEFRRHMKETHRVWYSQSDKILEWARLGPRRERKKLNPRYLEAMSQDDHPLVVRVYQRAENKKGKRIPREIKTPLYAPTCGSRKLKGSSFKGTYKNLVEVFKPKDVTLPEEIVPIVSLLSPKNQKVFSMYYLEGKIQRKVATELGLSQGAISHRITRIVRNIAFLLYFGTDSLEYSRVHARLEGILPKTPHGREEAHCLATHLSTGCKQVFSAAVTGKSQPWFSYHMSLLPQKVKMLPPNDTFREMLLLICEDPFLIQEVELPHFPWAIQPTNDPVLETLNKMTLRKKK